MTKLLTTEDVANLLNLKPSTIRKWVHLQEIPCVRLGRAVRFEYDKIVEWVRERRAPAREWDLQSHGVDS